MAQPLSPSLLSLSEEENNHNSNNDNDNNSIGDTHSDENENDNVNSNDNEIETSNDDENDSDDDEEDSGDDNGNDNETKKVDIEKNDCKKSTTDTEQSDTFKMKRQRTSDPGCCSVLESTHHAADDDENDDDSTNEAVIKCGADVTDCSSSTTKRVAVNTQSPINAMNQQQTTAKDRKSNDDGNENDDDQSSTMMMTSLLTESLPVEVWIRILSYTTIWNTRQMMQVHTFFRSFLTTTTQQQHQSQQQQSQKQQPLPLQKCPFRHDNDNAGLEVWKTHAMREWPWLLEHTHHPYSFCSSSSITTDSMTEKTPILPFLFQTQYSNLHKTYHHHQNHKKKKQEVEVVRQTISGPSQLLALARPLPEWMELFDERNIVHSNWMYRPQQEQPSVVRPAVMPGAAGRAGNTRTTTHRHHFLHHHHHRTIPRVGEVQDLANLLGVAANAEAAANDNQAVAGDTTTTTHRHFLHHHHRTIPRVGEVQDLTNFLGVAANAEAAAAVDEAVAGDTTAANLQLPIIDGVFAALEVRAERHRRLTIILHRQRRQRRLQQQQQQQHNNHDNILPFFRTLFLPPQRRDTNRGDHHDVGGGDEEEDDDNHDDSNHHFPENSCISSSNNHSMKKSKMYHQYTGQVGHGNRCLRANGPLPKPKWIHQTMNSTTNNLKKKKNHKSKISRKSTDSCSSRYGDLKKNNKDQGYRGESQNDEPSSSSSVNDENDSDESDGIHSDSSNDSSSTSSFGSQNEQNLYPARVIRQQYSNQYNTTGTAARATETVPHFLGGHDLFAATANEGETLNRQPANFDAAGDPRLFHHHQQLPFAHFSTVGNWNYGGNVPNHPAGRNYNLYNDEIHQLFFPYASSSFSVDPRLAQKPKTKNKCKMSATTTTVTMWPFCTPMIICRSAGDQYVYQQQHLRAEAEAAMRTEQATVITLAPRLVAYFEVEIRSPPPPNDDDDYQYNGGNNLQHREDRGQNNHHHIDAPNNNNDAPAGGNRRRRRRQHRPAVAVPREQCIAVGLCTSPFPWGSRMPGWDAASIGYHSDNGGLYCGSGHSTNRHYGPSFGPGDVVGCGIDYTTTTTTTTATTTAATTTIATTSTTAGLSSSSTSTLHASISADDDENDDDSLGNRSVEQWEQQRPTIFFTINGRYLGPARTVDIRFVRGNDLYPVVGIDSHDLVHCNFTGPFLFDLETY